MIKKLLLNIIVNIICFIPLYAENGYLMQVKSFGFYNVFNSQIEFNETICIENQSQEEDLTWISFEPIGNKSEEHLIRDYFIRRKKDFSFFHIMSDNLSQDTTSIGFTFIKCIKSGDKFNYNIHKTNKSSSFYKDRIVIIPKIKVERYFNFQIDEKYFFPENSIFLKEE